MDIKPLQLQFQELEAKAKQARADAIEYQAQADALGEAMVNYLLGNPSVCQGGRCTQPNRDLVFAKFWACPNSPTFKCVYDNDNDVTHFDCLFCGEPEDRT